jgi:hypothetical protein
MINVKEKGNNTDKNGITKITKESIKRAITSKIKKTKINMDLHPG